MAVHKGIAMGIVADGCVFGIVVAFAITLFIIALADLLSITIAMNWQFGPIASDKQIVFVN